MDISYPNYTHLTVVVLKHRVRDISVDKQVYVGKSRKLRYKIPGKMRVLKGIILL